VAQNIRRRVRIKFGLNQHIEREAGQEGDRT
jgi:hypothetical protein